MKADVRQNKFFFIFTQNWIFPVVKLCAIENVCGAAVIQAKLSLPNRLLDSQIVTASTLLPAESSIPYSQNVGVVTVA